MKCTMDTKGVEKRNHSFALYNVLSHCMQTNKPHYTSIIRINTVEMTVQPKGGELLLKIASRE